MACDIGRECGEFFEIGVYAARSVWRESDIVKDGMDAASEELIDDAPGENAVGSKSDDIVENKAVCGSFFDVADHEWLAHDAADFAGETWLEDMDIGVIVQRQNLETIIAFDGGFERCPEAIIPDIIARRCRAASGESLRKP